MFQKSSFCKADEPMCVEVDGLDTDRILVRNSKRPDLIAYFDREEWDAFIQGVKSGEFDLKCEIYGEALDQMEQV